jgi:tetrahydromethanopterin S-methyltransferase subunit B
MDNDLEKMGTVAVKPRPTMDGWPHEETTVASKGEETKLGFVFIAGLALFLFLLLAVGSLLRFIW